MRPDSVAQASGKPVTDEDEVSAMDAAIDDLRDQYESQIARRDHWAEKAKLTLSRINNLSDDRL